MTKVLTLKKRKDFVRVARQGSKMVSPSLILQAALSLSAPSENAFLGFTATKKIGKAHLRNRTKRRLRAAAREIFSTSALPAVDYVLIGRYNTASVDFSKLKEEMFTALKRINKILRKENSANDQTTPLCPDSAD